MAPVLVGAIAGYLQHQDILQLTNFNASTMSWVLQPSPAFPNSFVFYTRHPKYYMNGLKVSGHVSNACANGPNWQVTNTGVNTPMTVQPGLAPLGYSGGGFAAGQPVVSQTNNLYIQSSSVTNAAITAASTTCGGGIASWSTLANTLSGTTLWSLVPPLSCSTTCNTFGFSLASLGIQNGFLYVNASGAVKVGNALLNPDFTTQGASFSASRVFYYGTPGWVISSSLDIAAGNVLTRTVNAAIGCANYYQVVSMQPNASGITVSG